MLPVTINRMVALEVLSAMQKHIRRGEEVDAMKCACELGHTSKAYFSMVVNRLELISHEDIGLANPGCVKFVAASVEQSRRYYKPDQPGKWRLIVGNVILALCRSAKSREGDHFQAAIGGAALLDGTAPELPDYAFDHHTRKGKRLGRTIEYFFKESTKLVPKPKADKYQRAAHSFWRRKNPGNGQPKAKASGKLF